MTTPKYLYLNGDIVPWDKGQVHVASVAFKFGTSVFEGIRGYWNETEEQMYLFRLGDHMRRLTRSQTFMRFDDLADSEEIGRSIIELIRANELREDVHIAATVFATGIGGPATTGPIGVSITVGPWHGPSFVEAGCSAQVSSWQRVPDQAMPMRIKCGANYQNGRLAALQAAADGYDTAILLNSRGKVSEGPHMCFFIVRNGEALTPPVTSDILESITRDTALEILPKACDTAAVVRDIDRSELACADEAFFCGTAWEITPVTSIDRLPVGAGKVGPVVRRLQEAYFNLAAGRSNQHAEWRTAVY